MPSLRTPLGLLLAGYGLLVLAQVLPHESPLAGAVSLALGLLLLWKGVPRLQAPRARYVAAAGLTLTLGVLAYNAIRHSDLSTPELALLAYGLFLLLACPFLHRRIGRWEAGSIVGWSFPLALAPLCLFALNASFSNPQAGTAASPLIILLIVWPTAWALRATGTAVDVVGRDLIFATPRGGLTLDVGLVCAGIYPMVLFLGIIALHAWREKTPPRRLAIILAWGLLGLYLINLVRIWALAHVGIRWGPTMLASMHANLGWLFFALYMVLFWGLVMKRIERPRPNAA